MTEPTRGPATLPAILDGVAVGTTVHGTVGDTMQINLHEGRYVDWYWCDGKVWQRAESEHDAKLMAQRMLASAAGYSSLREWRAAKRGEINEWRSENNMAPYSDEELLQIHPDSED